MRENVNDRTMAFHTRDYCRAVTFGEGAHFSAWPPYVSPKVQQLDYLSDWKSEVARTSYEAQLIHVSLIEVSVPISIAS